MIGFTLILFQTHIVLIVQDLGVWLVSASVSSLASNYKSFSRITDSWCPVNVELYLVEIFSVLWGEMTLFSSLEATLINRTTDHCTDWCHDVYYLAVPICQKTNDRKSIAILDSQCRVREGGLVEEKRFVPSLTH